MKQRKGILACSLLIVFLSSILLGMSGAGTGSMNARSNVQQLFDAKLMDTDNNTVQLSAVTIEGRTAFQASMGKGKVTIPFEEISRIQIKGKTACVTLRNSKEVCDLAIRGSSRVSGNTSFGLYQIQLSDVVWIEFTKAR